MTFQTMHEISLTAAWLTRAAALDDERVLLQQRLLDGSGVLSDGDTSLEAVRARAEFCGSMASEYRELAALLRKRA